MDKVNALNIYLGDKRKYLLIALNGVLVVFIIFEVMIWNEVNGLLSAEEYREFREEFCKNPVNDSVCRKGR